jgi:hypothetical protein
MYTEAGVNVGKRSQENSTTLIYIPKLSSETILADWGFHARSVCFTSTETLNAMATDVQDTVSEP